jgi:hypothetical protein
MFPAFTGSLCGRAPTKTMLSLSRCRGAVGSATAIAGPGTRCAHERCFADRLCQRHVRRGRSRSQRHVCHRRGGGSALGRGGVFAMAGGEQSGEPKAGKDSKKGLAGQHRGDGAQGMTEGAAELDPAEARTPLSDEEVRNIIFNETRSLSGPGIDDARRELAHTIINADEAWGTQRGLHARTAPSTLPRKYSPAVEARTLQCIESIVSRVRLERTLSIDPTRGATNFNIRPFASTRPPYWGPRLILHSVHGPFQNTLGSPQYIHIWRNPGARGTGIPF